MPQITLRQVAIEAGVSPATVSLALRSSPKIPSATSERVQAAAKKLGYQTNPLVSALMARQRAMKKRTPESTGATLAFITPHRISHLINQIPWDAPAEIFHGASTRARLLGYHLVEIPWMDEGLSGPRLNTILQARGIVGLIFSEMPSLEDVNGIEWARFALASIGTRTHTPALTYAQSDHYENMALAMQEVFKLGYRRPGLALRTYLEIVTRHRSVAAFLQAQSRLPLADRTHPLIYEESREDIFKEWIHKERPDVVITGNYRVRGWIERAGFTVPGTVGMVHLDVSPDKSDCSGVHENRLQTGAEAVDAVVAQIHRNERGLPRIPKGIYIESEWVRGKTLREMR